MKEEINNKLRIKDIATLAGVSAGTVDRVIHNRGQVTAANREKIGKIIEELNYKPNLIARSLALKKSYQFVTLLPEYTNDNEYWEAPNKGIQKAWKEIMDYNISVKSLYFNQFDINSFILKYNELLQLSPDAVLLSPVFKSETISLTTKLNERQIPYCFIDSNIDGLNNITYFGQHSYHSGYLAAKLLCMNVLEKSTIAVINGARESEMNQITNREAGFLAFFESNNLKTQYQFVNVNYELGNAGDRLKQFEHLFNSTNKVAAAIVFNSRVHEIANYIENKQLANIKLIGYDLLPKNAEYLRNGVVAFLIAQRPEEQGYRGIMSLFNHLILKKETAKVQYVPIDILTSENLDYYLNFK